MYTYFRLETYPQDIACSVPLKTKQVFRVFDY